MKSNKNPLVRTKNIVVQNSGDEILIYDLDKHKAFCLNKTLGSVWKACDGTRSVSEIVMHLKEEVDMAASAELVNLSLIMLSENSLLTDVESGSFSTSKLSRRTLIKNAALGSMAALPVISHLVAPRAASAQSGCVNPGGSPPNTPVNTFTDFGGCNFLLESQCCSNAITDYVFTECCSSPQIPGIGTCTGVCV